MKTRLTERSVRKSLSEFTHHSGVECWVICPLTKNRDGSLITTK